MNRPLSSPQAWVHWLEQGRGARWLRWVACGLAIAGGSWLLAYKQFRGPLSEPTFLQADLGRNLAAGRGFVTQVNYPQTAAFLKARGQDFDPAVPFPELTQPPLYALAIAGVLSLLPERLSRPWFDTAPAAPLGFGGDYLLLGLNIALLWLAAGLTWVLGRKLFDARAGWWAALGLLLSIGAWRGTVALTGLPLMMVVLLGVVLSLAWAETASGRRARWWQGLAGLGLGLAFLGEYTAGAALLPVLIYVAWPRSGRLDFGAAAWVLGGFVLVATPWLWRNTVVAGHPLGLAWHDVALRAGDPTADPGLARTRLVAEAPVLELRKLAHKGLAGWQEALQSGLWSGGLFFTAFFVVGCLYRFREPRTNRLRWLVVALLGTLVTAQALLNSGETERLATAFATPLLLVFGAGFLGIMVASQAHWAERMGLCGAILLALQALPLGREALAPRRLHFNYPPYYPEFYVSLRSSWPARHLAGWMADTPAGAAWYADRRVWAQPAQLREFHLIYTDQPIWLLVLTPHTLDRPYFSELLRVTELPSRLGSWAQVYAGLAGGKVPLDFPLRAPQKLADNFYVFRDPRTGWKQGP